MDQPHQQDELDRLIKEAPPVVPAKPTKNNDPTDPLTYETVEDSKTGKCHSSLQNLLVCYLVITIMTSYHSLTSNLYQYIAPGSVTKPLQEESKKEEEKGSDKPFMTEKTLKAIQLPRARRGACFLGYAADLRR